MVGNSLDARVTLRASGLQRHSWMMPFSIETRSTVVFRFIIRKSRVWQRVLIYKNRTIDVQSEITFAKVNIVCIHIEHLGFSFCPYKPARLSFCAMQNTSGSSMPMDACHFNWNSAALSWTTCGLATLGFDEVAKQVIIFEPARVSE